ASVGNRERLVKALAERLTVGIESGDPASVGDAAVLRLAQDLAGTLTGDSLAPVAPEAVEAITALVTVHWARYRILPEGQDEEDMRACLRWAGVFMPVMSPLVPSPVREYLPDSDTLATVSPAEAND